MGGGRGGGREPAKPTAVRVVDVSLSKRLLVATLAVVALALSAIAALGAIKVSGQADALHSPSVRSAVLAAANREVTAVLTYDYRHLDADVATARAGLTPKFQQQYDDLVRKAVRPLATQSHAISTADIVGSGVVTASPGRATVLILVNQTATNSTKARPELDRPRLLVTMVRSGGRWLVDGIDTK